MDTLCRKNKLRAVKLVRATMEDIEHLLHRNKECVSQFKVIHLLRDPRDTLKSLYRCCGFNYTDQGMISEMCNRQIRDIEIAQKLDKLYPDTFIEVQYENLAADTIEVAEILYKFLFASPLMKKVKDWIELNNRNTSEKLHNSYERENFLKMDGTVENNCKALINYLIV